MSIRQALSRFEENEFGNIDRRAQRRRTKVQYQNDSQDRLLKLASTFNSKLSEELVARDKERIEREKEEAIVLADEQGMEMMEKTGKSPVSPEDQKTYDDGVKTLDENKKNTQKVARDVLKESGNYDQAKKIENLSGHALYEYTKRRSEIAANNVQAWLQGEMIKNDTLEFVYEGKNLTPKTAETLEEKAAALKELRKEYIRINGLAGVSTEIKAEEEGLFAKSIEAKAALMKQYTTMDSIKRSFEDKEKAADVFREANHKKSSFNDLHQAMRLTVDDNGSPISEEAALDETIKVIESQMKTGEFTRNKFIELGNQIVTDPTTGKPGKLKDVWPSRYLELEDTLEEAEKDIEAAKQAKIQTGFEKEERIILEKAADLPDDEKLAFVTKEQAKLYKKYPGYESTRINRFVTQFAKGSAHIEQKGKAYEQMRNGTLTISELSKYSSQIQQDETLKKFATRLTEEQAGGPVKEFIEEVNTAIAFKINQGGIDKKNPTVKPMERYAKTKFDAFLATAIANDHPNPADFARQSTLAWLDTYTSSRKNFTEDGYINIPGTLTRKELKQTNKLHNEEVKRQKEILSTYKETILTSENIGKLISKEELVESMSDYLKTGANPTSFDYPGEIDTLYKYLADGKKSKFDVMNDVLQLHGLPTLGNKPPSIEKFDNNTNKADNVTLSNKTFDTAARIWGKIATNTGEPNLELFPNNLGKSLFDWSEANSMDYSTSASAMEFLYRHPTLASNFGFTEQDLGFMQMPPTTSTEGVDWDRFGMAVNVLSWKARSAVGDKFEDWGDHWNTVAENFVKDFKLKEFANYLAPPPEESANPNVRSGKLKPEMPSNNPNLTATTLPSGVKVLDEEFDPDSDLGKQVGENIMKELSIIGNETVSLINNWVDSILDLDEDQERELAVSNYKNSGDVSHLPIRK